MGKITFYCNICAGPFQTVDLRKLSTAQPGDDRLSCLEDYCDCMEGEASEDEESNGHFDEDETGSIAEQNEHQGTEDSASHDDLPTHEKYCTTRRGYWGDVLRESDISWLDGARMLRPGIDPDPNLEETHQPLDDGSPYYLTDIGDYDPWWGLTLPRKTEKLWPNEDGFLLHDTCWKMLQLVHRIRGLRQRDLTPRHLYHTMLSKMIDVTDSFIEWGDERLYNGPEQFAGQEWEPVPGYEWLVADPMKELEFSELISQSISTSNGLLEERVAVGTPKTLPFVDLFASFPQEVLYMILELLPSKSVLNLFLSSPTFRELSRKLPISFWRSRLGHDFPWLEGTSFYARLAAEKGKVNYRLLMNHLKTAGGKPSGGRNTREDRFLGLKNRRRIWTCCEGILDVMGLWGKTSGLGTATAEMEAIVDLRVARICPSPKNPKPSSSHTYFRPAVSSSSPIQSVTVYFTPLLDITGIEWLLEGESTRRLFGNQTQCFQSVLLPCDLEVRGILLSLGPFPNDNSPLRIRGFGIMSKESPNEPQVKLGRWSDNDLVQVFRPASERSSWSIVGIGGEFNADGIFTFGLLTADVENNKPAPLLPITKNLDIYTRWLYPHIPRHGQTIDIRYGITGFPLPTQSPLSPPIVKNPTVFVDLDNKQLEWVRAFFPLGERKELGGLLFRFADGNEQLVGSAVNHQTVEERPEHTIEFDVAGNEVITGVVHYFDSNIDRTTPSRLHGLEFRTDQFQALPLGYLDAYNEHYRRESNIRDGQRVVGLHIGIQHPVLESIGLVVV